jgi:hypothetical protein
MAEGRVISRIIIPFASLILASHKDNQRRKNTPRATESEVD